MRTKAGSGISRRVVLGGLAAAGAAGTGLLPRRAMAEASVMLGENKVRILSDGSLTLPAAMVIPDRDPAEIKALLEPRGMPYEALTPDCNITLLQTGDRLVLFDAGSGPLFQSTAGKLPDSLEEAGIALEEITDVVFTHAHPDHLWGVIDDFDEMVFPDAAHHFCQAEWDFWAADETLDAMPEERKTFVVGAQNRFEAIEDQVTFFNAGDEILPGVEAVDTAGHTPGHISFMLHGGSESMLVVGDAITHPIVSFEKPDWPSGSDQDRDMGAKTRLALLDRLASDKSGLIGFHLPHPGIGRAERDGSAFRFVPD